MRLKDFKVGQHLVKIGGLDTGMTGTVVEVGDEIKVCVSPHNYYWIRSQPENWEIAQLEPAQVIDWSYAEAQRLAEAADAAIEAYNEYIKKQPKTVFIPKIK